MKLKENLFLSEASKVVQESNLAFVKKITKPNLHWNVDLGTVRKFYCVIEGL